MRIFLCLLFPPLAIAENHGGDAMLNLVVQEEANRLNKELPMTISPKHGVVYFLVEAKDGNTIQHTFQHNNLIKDEVDPEIFGPQLNGMKKGACEKYRNEITGYKHVYLSGELFNEFIFVDKNGEEINSIKFACN